MAIILSKCQAPQVHTLLSSQIHFLHYYHHQPLSLSFFLTPFILETKTIWHFSFFFFFKRSMVKQRVNLNLEWSDNNLVPLASQKTLTFRFQPLRPVVYRIPKTQYCSHKLQTNIPNSKDFSRIRYLSKTWVLGYTRLNWISLLNKNQILNIN